jgi:hypothetical protein
VPELTLPSVACTSPPRVRDNRKFHCMTPCYIVKEEFPDTSGFAAESTVGTSGWRDA